MIKKLLGLLTLFSVFAIVISGCGKSESPLKEITKNVEVQIIKEENTPLSLNYSGIVSPDHAKGLSFKTSGKIVGIHVEENDYVKEGTVIALLDQENPDYALKASEANLEAALLDYNKATESYLYAADQFSKIQDLYETGAVPQNDYEKANLSAKTAKISMEQAEVNYQKLIEDYNLKISNLNDTELIADMSGYILSVNYKNGDVIQAGMPIVNIYNGKKKIVIGLTESDLTRVKENMDVKIKYQDSELNGKVSLILQEPDQATRTYPVEITVNAKELPLAAIVETSFNIGETEAIWIPLNSILSSTIDYVYLAQDDKAVKKAVNILEVQGSRARVEGLEVDDQLIVKGMKSIKEGNALQIVN